MWWLWLAARQRGCAVSTLLNSSQELSRNCNSLPAAVFSPGRPSICSVWQLLFYLTLHATSAHANIASMLHFGFSQESEHVVTQFSVSTHRLDKWKADADFQILTEAFLPHAEADGKRVKSRLMLLTCKKRPESPLDIAWCLFAPLFCHRLKLHCTTRGCCCCLSHRKHEHSGTCHKS